MASSGYFDMNYFYLKVMFFGVIPIVLTLFSALIWTPIALIKRCLKKESNLKRNIGVTFLTLVYLCYPSIASLSFSLFNCHTFEDGS